MFSKFKIIYKSDLNTSFIIISLIAMQNLEIYILNKNNMKNAYFYPGINRFFDSFSLAI